MTDTLPYPSLYEGLDQVSESWKKIMADKEIQTRDVDGETRFFSSIGEAFGYAETRRSVWKISWHDSETNERVRMVRDGSGSWRYEPISLRHPTVAKHNVFDDNTDDFGGI